MAKRKTAPGRQRKAGSEILFELRSIELRRARGKGRGVFALRDFAPGELIERAPVIPLSEKDMEGIADTILHNYAYGWSEKASNGALVMGLGSFYNHSYTPNARMQSDEEELAMEVVAKRPIKAGHEITVNYSGRGHGPLWFKVKA